MNGRPWAQNEINYLTANAGKIPMKHIADYLSRSEYGTRCKTVKLGVSTKVIKQKIVYVPPTKRKRITLSPHELAEKEVIQRIMGCMKTAGRSSNNLLEDLANALQTREGVIYG
jgi:hypothetical protein